MISRILLAALLALVVGVPVAALLSGPMWFLLDDVLRFGCDIGRGEGEGMLLCGDGMRKVLPTAFLFGAVVAAGFGLALPALTRGGDRFGTLYPVVATVAIAPVAVWLLGWWWRGGGDEASLLLVAGAGAAVLASIVVAAVRPRHEDVALWVCLSVALTLVWAAAAVSPIALALALALALSVPWTAGIGGLALAVGRNRAGGGASVSVGP